MDHHIVGIAVVAEAVGAVAVGAADDDVVPVVADVVDDDAATAVKDVVVVNAAVVPCLALVLWREVDHWPFFSGDFVHWCLRQDVSFGERDQ